MASYTSYIYEVLAFLLPIAIYCLVLASINRGTAPVVVGGFWDALGLLFAASGFLLGTIPMILTDFYVRAVAMHADEPFFAIVFRHLMIWLVYFLMVISGCAFMVLLRRRKTMIYNVDTDLFRHVLAESFAPMGMDVTVQNQRVEIAPAAASMEGTGVMEGLPAASATIPRAERYAELEIESFPAMCHVTLHWRHFTSPVREQIERELEKRLRNAVPVDNPAAGWFMSISGLIFGMLVMMVVLLVLTSLARG